MTIEERLLFIRAGYSAQDIANFEAAEEAVAAPAPAAAAPAPAAAAPAPAAEAPAPAAEAPAQDMPIWASALQKSIEDLTRAQQGINVRLDDMGEQLDVQQMAERALTQYLNGNKPNKGGKSK